MTHKIEDEERFKQFLCKCEEVVMKYSREDTPLHLKVGILNEVETWRNKFNNENKKSKWKQQKLELY